MSTLRMTSDLRRQLILVQPSVVLRAMDLLAPPPRAWPQAAAISEALLFKHFPSKAALYAEILTDECEADPDLAHLLGQEPSTATLVELVRGMVGHFLQIMNDPNEEEAQRLRLLTTSHLDDGEFARLLYGKVEDLIGPLFKASLDRAVAAGEASRICGEPLNLFWFAHHAVLMTALSRLPAVPCLSYGNAVDLERQLCEFLLRGIGLDENAIDSHLDRDLAPEPGSASHRKCMT